MQAKSIAIAMFFSSLCVLPVCVSANETVTSIKPAWVAVPDADVMMTSFQSRVGWASILILWQLLQLAECGSKQH